MAKRGGLGKGLDALFIDNETAERSGVLMTLRLSEIEPNKDQPRKAFPDEELRELSDSIREHGVLQPLVVRGIPGGGYQIIAGERRWRASRLAGLTEVPAIVVEADDRKAMELALVENLQRQDLNPMDESRGYRSLMEQFGLTQEQVASRVGKSRPAVANSLRLLELSAKVQQRLERGEISTGHAKVLGGVKDAAEQAALAELVSTGKLSVRQLEQELKKRAASAKMPPERKPSWGDSGRQQLELSINEVLGRRARLHPKGEGGMLELEYFSAEDLRALVDSLEKALGR